MTREERQQLKHADRLTDRRLQCRTAPCNHHSRVDACRMLLFDDVDEIAYAEYEAAMRDFIKSTNPKVHHLSCRITSSH